MITRDNVPFLVVGKDSLVGGGVSRQLTKAGQRFLGTSRRAGSTDLQLDLAAPDFSLLDKENFLNAIITVAVTDMQTCEADPEGSRKINVENTLELMRRLSYAGTNVVFLSSSQVFDGNSELPSETALTRPRNVYGRQKLEVEEVIQKENLPVAVLRLSKVLAAHPVGMFLHWHQALSRGEHISPASNMSLSPVTVEDVAEAALRLAEEQHRGIWHLSASDSIPYDSAARLMAKSCGFDSQQVRSQVVAEDEVPAIFRQKYTSLKTSKIVDHMGISIRNSSDVLDNYFIQIKRTH